MKEETAVNNKELISTKRIAKNTLMLYFRQILIMVVSLYTVRVVLNVLGAEDYGINNVVAGFVTMFNFLSSAMATASQRYFSYDLGKDNQGHLNRTFCATFIIYIILCLFILLIAETVGLWFVMNKLVIPAERKTAAFWIYQFSIVSFIMTLITTPYKASIIAHESMDVYAYISIVEAVLKLAVVFVLQVISLDKLILYGLLHCIVVGINTLMYRIYAKKKFNECKFHFLWDSEMLKDMVSYSGWNLFGAVASVLKSQGINIVLNLFFGPVVNAARGVSYQVNNAVVTFSNNFSTAMRPQIIKTYAAGNTEKSLKMVSTGSKLAYFLMFIFTLPLCLEADFVLGLWLKNPPVLASLFTKLVLINAMLDSFNYPIMTLAQATGKIKLYQSVVGGLLLLNLPISYVLLKLGYSAYVPFIVIIMMTVFAAIVRLFMVKRLVGFSISNFCMQLYIPCLLVSIVSFIIPYLLTRIMNDTVIRFFIVCICSVIMILSSLYFLGLSREEKKIFISFINKKVFKKEN